MCYSLHDIEKKQNIILPERYKQLYQSDFRDIDGKSIVRINGEEFHIKKFLTVAEIIHALDEFYDLWGYDIVPIAEDKWDDYICLYYKNSRNVPTIVYWNYELVLENPNSAICFLYDSIETFENELKSPQWWGIDPDNT